MASSVLQLAVDPADRVESTARRPLDGGISLLQRARPARSYSLYDCTTKCPLASRR